MQLTVIPLSFWLVNALSMWLLATVYGILLKPRWEGRFFKPILIVAMDIVFSLVGHSFPQNIRVLICIGLYLLIPFIAFKGRVATKLLAGIFYIVLYFAAEAVVLLISPVIGWYVGMGATTAQMVLNIAIFAVAFFLFQLIRSSLKLFEERLESKLWLQLVLTALAIFLTVGVTTVNAYHLQGHVLSQFLTEHIDVLNTIGVCLSLAALLSLFSLVYRLNTSIRESETAHFMEAQARMELSQSKALAAKDEQYRQLRHDFRNHLLAIDALGQEGDFKRQHEYLVSLNAAFAQTQARSYCEHRLLDGLFRAKEMNMEAAGIDVVWKLNPVADPFPVSDMDLCALVGNALDNAIEGCERLEPGIRRWIEVALRADEQGFFFRVANACPGASKLISAMEKRSGKRPAGSGVGLKSIRRAVDNYKGEFVVSAIENDTALAVSVYLPVKAG